MQQSSPTSRVLGVAEDCYMLSILLAVPSCFNVFFGMMSSLHPTSFLMMTCSFTTSRILGVSEDCCMLAILLAVPSCFNGFFWYGAIPTSYIFADFNDLL